jgi:hypothetical protein
MKKIYISEKQQKEIRDAYFYIDSLTKRFIYVCCANLILITIIICMFFR